MVSNESFSDSYAIVNGVDKYEYPGDEFLMDAVLHERLEVEYGDPSLLVKLGKSHYEPSASLTVPGLSVVIPDYIEDGMDGGEDSLLILKGDGGPFSNLW